MKKMLLMAAIASVVFASCVNDEVANPKNQIKKKIKFDNPVLYCNENSRANVTGEIGGGSYPQDENFVIYAVSHENDFAGWAASGTTAAEFNGATVSYDVDVNGCCNLNPLAANTIKAPINRTKLSNVVAVPPTEATFLTQDTPFVAAYVKRVIQIIPNTAKRALPLNPNIFHVSVAFLPAKM